MIHTDLRSEPVNHKRRGDAFLNQGRLAEAAACYKQAIASTPNDADAFINLGFISLEQNCYVEAVSYLERAVLINPQGADAFYMLGLIYEKKRMTADALKAWKDFLNVSQDKTKRDVAEKHIHHLSLND